MLYLHDIVGAPAVLAVARTLCLEVQFYLVVVIVALLASALTRTEAHRRTVIHVGASGLTLASLTLILAGGNAGGRG